VIFVGDRCITMLVRKPRSRWYTLRCFGPKRHYRKDGTCRHVDQVLASVKPDKKHLVRVEPHTP